MNRNFRRFLELTASKPLSHLDAIKDELGIRPEDLMKTPQVLGNFKLGDTYNLGTYRILGYEYDESGKPTMVRVQLLSDPTFRTQKKFTKVDGKYVRMNDDQPDGQVFTVPIAKFNKMLTQGMQQPAQGGQGMSQLPGGGMPSIPGGGM